MAETGKTLKMVLVTDLFVNCSYPMRPDAIAASDTCQKSATCAVIDPVSKVAYFRCSGHKGLLRDGAQGEIVISVPHRGD
jgi:hypothetical protein